MQRRPLIIAGGVALALIIVGLVVGLALSRRGTQTLPENTPAGTVQRFLAGLETQDYQLAFTYLTTINTDNKPRDYEDFRNSVGFRGQRPSVQVALDGEKIEGDRAEVAIIYSQVSSSPSLPFSNPINRQRDRFVLKHEGNTWRILEYPWGLVSLF